MPAKKSILTPEEVASRQNPLWEVASTGHDSVPDAVADDVSPDLDVLIKKFSTPKTTIDKKKKLSEEAVFSVRKTDPNPVSLVKMVQKDPSDSSVRSKTVIIQGGKVVGESG